jgi:heme exporter protein D
VPRCETQLARLAALAVLMRMASGVALSLHGFRGQPMVVLSVSATAVLTALELWALTWLSTPMAAPLEIDGFGTFVWATALLTLVTTPIWVLDQAARARRQEMAELDRHQEMAARQQQALLSLSLVSARIASRGAERWRGRR